ncbi:MULTISPECIES: class I SAM-dependent methyltransferase [Streptomyces]|uniref:class I SAM-dependent methyltransferase n=1 Tax=Streptomyces TaxID=1883 RepID=UPI001D4A930B|nr:class I SAM-dependent methyltransferase [Streptomyces sp. MAG02]
MYGRELADVYETIYRSRGKDWGQEARDVARLIAERRPGADSLLDVACGTGAHLSVFSTLFEVAEGLEIAEPMRRLAEQRLPDVTVHAGDMRDFALGRSYSAVSCMFCAIGYLETVADMRAAIGSMAGHLEPGGVLVVEPWWFPENFIEGYVAGDLAREEHRTIARISHTTRKGRATRMEVRFTVGDAAGIKEFTEIDVLTLFTKDEYVSAFTDAGCSVEFLADGPTGRGLFVGVRESA